MDDFITLVNARMERLFARGFHFKLNQRKPADRELAQHMAETLESGDDILSELVRNALLTYYRSRAQGINLASLTSSWPQLGMGDNNGSHHAVAEDREDPEDELVRRMAGASFDQFG